MIADRLVCRNLTFQVQPQYEIVKQMREDRSVTLRKRRRFECLSKKRKEQSLLPAQSFNLQCFNENLTKAYPCLSADNFNDIERLRILLSISIQSKVSLGLPAIIIAESYLASIHNPRCPEVLTPEICEGLTRNLQSRNEDLIYHTLCAISSLFVYSSQTLHLFQEFSLIDIGINLIRHTNAKIVAEALTLIYNYSIEIQLSSSLTSVLTKNSFDLFSKPKLATEQNYSSLSDILRILQFSTISSKCAHEIFKLVSKLLDSKNLQTIFNALETLFSLSIEFNEITDQTLLLVPRIIRYLDSNDYKFQVIILRIIRNLLSGSEYQVQMTINMGIIDKIIQQTINSSIAVRREACFCLGNILTGKINNIASVLSHPRFEIHRILTDPDMQVREEGLWWVNSIINSRSKPMIDKLIQLGVIILLVDSLNYSQPVFRAKVIKVTKELLKYLNKVTDCKYWEEVEEKLKECEKKEEWEGEIFHINNDEKQVDLYQPKVFVFS